MAKAISFIRNIIGLSVVAWRLLIGHGLRRQRLIFFIQVGVIGLSVCSAVLVLTLSFSFRQAIAERLYSYLGGLWIRYYGEEQESRPLPIDKRHLVPLQGKGLDIEAAIHLPVLIEGAGQRYEGINLIAVDASWWSTAWRALVSQAPSHWDGDSLVILSRSLARRLGVVEGDWVTIVWLADPPRIRRLRLVGLYEARIEEIDRQVAFAPIELGQRLLGWDSTEVQVAHLFPPPGARVDSLGEALSYALPYSYELVPIQHVFSDVFDWLGLIQQNVQVILGIILGLSFFSAASAFLVLQFAQRLRYEICWVLGASPRQLWQITFYQAVAVVALGVAVGELLAGVLLLGQDRGQWIRLEEESYLISTIPIYWRVSPFVLVGGGGLFMAVLMAVLAYPRRRAVRLLSHTE
ncbi:MAG: hypothetical protein N2170_05460 [Bacteroidia bacterium]|nr:hypothetical protein [Bacteroidia bacterium]